MTRTLVWLALIALLPTPAAAFCGFFVSGADATLSNNASQVVLMRKGQRTVLTMSNTYKGPTEDFAMVVPVPTVLQKDQVKTLPADVFSKIDKLSAPRLVEYWEQDPCYVAPDYDEDLLEKSAARPRRRSAVKGGSGSFGVKVEAQFTAGEYEIVILSAKEANGLESWLQANKYNIPAGASDALAPYIKSGQKFFVAKVNIKKVKRDTHGNVVLSPLRFHYEDAQLRLPVRLGLLNASGKQDLIVYVLHPKSRFEAANYKNVFIPSNLEVLDDVRTGFGAFYAALFDRTLEKAGGRAVVTEYAWQSSKCDPCPVPPLQPGDIYALGGDVFGESSASKKNVGRRRAFFGPSSSWVLTRMHTRYDTKSLDEDLIFVEARPVVGGRGSQGISREKPGAVNLSSVNNFQGRYIIRNYWAGAVQCENPQWGRWGGPPRGGKKLQAAGDLANAPRDTIKLAKTIRSSLPELGIQGMPAPAKRKGEK